jgi:nucleoside-diphosphate-sugar epimerase
VTQDFTFNGERARRELGYQPIYDEDQAISRTARWFKEHGPVQLRATGYGLAPGDS